MPAAPTTIRNIASWIALIAIAAIASGCVPIGVKSTTLPYAAVAR